MEIDVRKETIKALKDLGIDQATLNNRENAVIIDALKNICALLRHENIIISEENARRIMKDDLLVKVKKTA